MAVNEGIAPPDFTTEVGAFRLDIGDTVYEELDPPKTGHGSYGMFGDAEIEAYIARADSREQAVADAFLSLATSAALEAKSVKDFDLQVSTEKRAEYLMSLARMWRDRADSLSGEVFETFDVSIRSGRDRPELAARPICL